MRLICPNCGAQYEVADDVIPVSGRDVQCSNCNHTWFEHPGASEALEYAAAEPELAPEPETVDEPTPEPEPPAEPEPAPEPEPETEPVADIPATFADAPEPEPVVAAAAGLRAPRREVPPGIAEILREEAAREEAARRAEAASGLETQSELALDTAPTPDRAFDDNAARTATPTATTPVPAPPSARRDLLPDIEEINSTLRSASERGPVAAEQTARAVAGNRRGFRYGFSLILLIAAALAMVYVYTPRIIVAVPQAEPILTPYADAVDDGRLWLDLRLQDLLQIIDPEQTDAPAEG